MTTFVATMFIRRKRHTTIIVLISITLAAILWLRKASKYEYEYVESRGWFDPQESDYAGEDSPNRSEERSGQNLGKYHLFDLDNEQSSGNKTFLNDDTSQQRSNEKTVTTNEFLISARFNRNAKNKSLACVSEISVLECDNLGLAAMLLATLDHFVFCSIHNAIPTVMWKNCGTVCSRNSFNSWEWYFEPVNPSIEKNFQSVICIAGSVSLAHFPIASEKLFYSWWNSQKTFRSTSKTQFTPKPLLNLTFQKRSFSFGTISEDERNWANSLLMRYVRVRKDIREEIEKFYNEHMADSHVLGVHIRGTDHWLERDQRILIPLSTWFQNAEKIFRSLQEPRKIYIASDNIEAIKYFLKKFGKDKVLFISAVRAKLYHGSAVHTSGFSPRRLGTEVLKDTLLLAKCQHFLHGESSVAALASYFNPNMTSHLVEENSKNGRVAQKHPTSVSVDHAKEKRMARSRASVKKIPKKHNRFSGEKTKIQTFITDDAKADGVEAVKCFKRNSLYSACPNFKTGRFIKLEEIPGSFSR